MAVLLFKKAILRIAKPELLILITAQIITVLVYGYYALGITDKGEATKFYTYMGEAFLAGQTHLLQEPAPEIAKLKDPYAPLQNNPYRLHDASYYNGKYYLYYGPVPALVVWIPVKLLTGVALADKPLALILASVGTCFLYLLVYMIVIRQTVAHKCRHRLGFICVLMSIGLTTWLPFVLRTAHFYEVSIIGAYCFSAMGITCFWKVLHSRRQTLWSLLAGLCFGLAAGCRIVHIAAGVFLIVLLFYRVRAARSWAAGLRSVFWMGVPILVSMISLGVYNYVRFDSPFEVGASYQLGLYNMQKPGFRLYTPESIPVHTWRYLLHSLRFREPLEFPFFSIRSEWGQYPSPRTEPVYGIFRNSPFSLFCLLFILSWKKRGQWRSEEWHTGMGLLLYGSIMLAALLPFFFSTQRYTIDYAPWLMTAAGLMYLHLIETYEDKRFYKILILTGVLATVYGLFNGLMSGYCGYTLECGA